MLFQSFEYLVFLAAILSVWWQLPRRGQNVLLLFAGAIFYGWIHPWFLMLLLTSTLTDYACGLGLGRSGKGRKRWLALSLTVNLAMLGYFKYRDFFLENVMALGLGFSEPTLRLVLPVGISFYTFQTLSYTIDVYRGRLEPHRDLLDYAVYVSFFPQLVAGPIERAGRLLPQVSNDRRFDAVAAREGILLMVWGFFKKLVVADNVSITADRIFSLNDPSWPLLWVGVLGFGVQIFADFSAYTDIARGTARLLGFELAENFRHPYLSRSPSEFWRRWHITLSTWFRDYVYIPLGGNRRRHSINLLIVFLVSGLWHGARWNFVVWGAYWGALLLITQRLPAPPRWAWPLQVLGTFALTNLGWLIFRESDGEWLWRLLRLDPGSAPEADWAFAGLLLVHVLVCATPLVLQTALDVITRARLGEDWQERTLPWRALGASLLFLGILTLRSSRGPDFIYFQF